MRTLSDADVLAIATAFWDAVQALTAAKFIGLK